jgi:hypothetical protein
MHGLPFRPRFVAIDTERLPAGDYVTHLWHARRWGMLGHEVHVIMFTLYIDDSGTAPDQHVAIATALIIPAAQIIRLEKEWETFRVNEGFKCFHTSPFIARNPKTEFANWDDVKQERVLRRVRQISRKYGVRALSVAVHKKDYDDIVPESHRYITGKYHYTWAVRQLITLQAVRFNETKPPREYIFQWMGKPTDSRKIEIDRVMSQANYYASRFKTGEDYSNYSFRQSDDIPGLQCVDAIAWVCYQKALEIFRKTPLHPLAVASWNDFGGHLGSKGWLYAGTILRDSLEKSINKLISNGEVKRYVDDWREANQNF